VSFFYAREEDVERSPGSRIPGSFSATILFRQCGKTFQAQPGTGVLVQPTLSLFGMIIFLYIM